MITLKETTGQPIIQSTERVCAFDALRGIMMLLGVVIHAAITYGNVDYESAWPLKNPNNHVAFDIIVILIHSFRMPVFFVAAGYFGALLFYKKGASEMLKNRFRRIFLPLLAGLLIIYPLVRMAFVFSQASFQGQANAFDTAVTIIVSGNFLPFSLVHLWFLYFLIFYSVAGWLLASVFNKSTRFTIIVNSLYHYLIQNFWLRLITMSLLFFGGLYWMGTPFLKTSMAFNLDLALLTTYFVFFGTGWLLYRANSLPQLSVYPWWQLGIAFLLFLVFMFTPWPAQAWALLAQQVLAAVYSSLFIFGFLALFLTYFNTYSPRLSYLMEASYWVYIIHLPIVAFVPGLLAGLALPIIVKFIIVLLATSISSFASYHFAVRSTFIGMLLNGKVYRRKQISYEGQLAAKV